ncbi:1-acyl-sn-glycerol-3-phosphate acyltransferase [Nocardia sp. BMG51109]|uniref:lysophospholipid acyltransferase family protein n=1 Tax=Nocardia sp. BMG51109 TaxID=1056816 RepID=UPI000465D391|nr:lysophospholipid acyltransferase family protein [Nocardia sp. BMG51109]
MFSYWVIKWILVGPLLRVIGRPKAVNRSVVPVQGPVILAANHSSIGDWLYLSLMTQRQIHYLAKEEYFAGRGVKGWLSKFVCTATGQVPVDRRGGDPAEAALAAAKGIVAQGKVWGIFPEGTRSPDGRLYKGRTGAARVAHDTGVPVIPVAIRGAEIVAPRKMFRLTMTSLRPVRLIYGSPIYVVDGSSQGIRAATDKIMKQLTTMTGLEYVDDYARKGTKSVAQILKKAS